MAARIRKGDTVVVVTGADKGRRGAVLQILPKEDRAVVQGVRIAKRHTKPTGMGQPGGIIEKEMPLAASKVAIWNPSAKAADRVGIKKLADGKKVRFFKSNDEVLDV